MSGAGAKRLNYDEFLESAVASIEARLKSDYRISKRSIALFLLQGDREIESHVREREGLGYAPIEEIVAKTRASYSQPLSYVIALRKQQEARRLVAATVISKEKPRMGFAERLSRLMMNPVTGILILLAVLYVGLYQFVGVFGAGIVVDFIEGTVFGEWINPWVIGIVTDIIPWSILQDLFVGEYGVITLGLTYAFALILPLVGTFFIAFSIIEDSGYLPRLAMLIDRVFKRIGLSGRAVIPMVLGFGCDTMATIVTRTQETRRERVITTLLLALAIPCSAQLGVILAILSGSPASLLIWGGVVALVLLVVGYLGSRIIPGQSPSFYMEIPPLRLPKLSNVLIKTYTRMRLFFVEILPLFMLASVVLWIGVVTGLFDIILKVMNPLVEFIGLPPETATVFLFGFFRRDFGAAGLYDLSISGVISGVPLVVTAVTLTLFIPCIAQLLVMFRERGARTALAIALFIFPFAFLVGLILNRVLTTLGVSL